ncbi:MAG: hypothetical protein HFJ43_03180 [Clostridia bacterium]|nr:hypothetical protein [Clostridia bacterium]
MNLRELNIIYNKVPNFMQLTDARIIGLYMIFENNFVEFAIEIRYSDKGENKIGLFGFDIENKKILNLTKEEYINLLDKINKVNKGNQYLVIKEGLEKLKEIKNIVECDKYFVVTDEDSTQPKYKSKSYIDFREIDYKINTSISVLYCSPSIATSYTKFKIDKIDKNKLKDINYLTNVEVNIEYNNNMYNDFGNIRKIKKVGNELEVTIEPLQVTLLETLMMDEIYFNQITPEEMMKVMSNLTNAFEVGKGDIRNKNIKKYKYITTLDNFELIDEMLQIGDVIFSKSVEDVDTNKIKPNSKKCIYISTYIVAETISEAQKIAIQKIENTLNIMQLIEKNSYFYKLYNEKEEINEWDVRKIFIDYRIGEKFYIFNIFETEQSVYGSNRELIIKNYGYLTPQCDLALYNDEINQLILNNINKENNLSNAIYWLNKGIEEINIDLNKCVLYLNIALEYCANGEKGESFFIQNEEAKDIFKDVSDYIEEKYCNNKIATEIKNKLNWTLSSASLKNRFESMLKKLNINYTKEQFDTYNKIRDARNDIIHGRKKADIQKYDIINCYMFLSKVMFCKLKENQE